MPIYAGSNIVTLGNIPSAYVGYNRVLGEGGDKLQVPSTVASSSLVDYMIAPYVTESIDGSNIIDIAGNGSTTLPGELSISSNAIIGWTTGSELNISASQYSQTGSIAAWDGIENKNTWEMWFQVSDWDGASPDVTFFTATDSVTSNNIVLYNSDNLANKSTFNLNDSNNSTGLTLTVGSWYHMYINYYEFESGTTPGDRDYKYDYYIREKGDPSYTTFLSVTWGFKPIETINKTTAQTLLKGYSGYKLGVFRHYKDYILTNDDAVKNYNAEQAYFT